MNKKKSALQNWYKFKCQKVGNFCVDICNCLRIIAKLEWASVKVSRQLWCRNCDDSRFERREREKNKNKKFHWKINVNEINDNNIAYDGDKADVFVQKYVVFACLQWHQHSFYTRSQMERNEQQNCIDYFTSCHGTKRNNYFTWAMWLLTGIGHESEHHASCQ